MITIDVAVGSNGNPNLGINPTVRYCPCTFDPTYLTYYISYEENIGFMVGATPFSCKKTEENIGKFKEAFEIKNLK